MSHSLTSLYTLISAQVNGTGCSAASGGSFTGNSYSEALGLVAQLESDVLRSVLSAGSPAAAAAVVQTYQVGCTSLADRLYEYRCRTAAIKKKGEEEANGKYREIEEGLLRLLHHLQHRFPAGFDRSQPLSLSGWNTVRASLLERKAGVQNALEKADLPVQQKPWVLKPLEDILSSGNTPSYSTVDYLAHYLSYWENTFRNGTLPEQEVSHSLIELNYNEPSFIRCFIGHLYRQMEEEITLFERVAYWSEQLLICNRICTQSTLTWQPSLPLAREAVIGTIEKEIGILVNQLPYVKETGARPVTGSPVGQPLVITSLSVSQLAVLLRLLNDCSIVKSSNQSAFLKGLVSAVRTEKTTKLSVDNLRNKYYSPEKAAVSIVKDYLFQMMNRLKDL